MQSSKSQHMQKQHSFPSSIKIKIPSHFTKHVKVNKSTKTLHSEPQMKMSMSESNEDRRSSKQQEIFEQLNQFAEPKLYDVTCLSPWDELNQVGQENLDSIEIQPKLKEQVAKMFIQNAAKSSLSKNIRLSNSEKQLSTYQTQKHSNKFIDSANCKSFILQQGEKNIQQNMLVDSMMNITISQKMITTNTVQSSRRSILFADPPTLNNKSQIFMTKNFLNIEGTPLINKISQSFLANNFLIPDGTPVNNNFLVLDGTPINHKKSPSFLAKTFRGIGATSTDNKRSQSFLSKTFLSSHSNWISQTPENSIKQPIPPNRNSTFMGYRQQPKQRKQYQKPLLEPFQDNRMGAQVVFDEDQLKIRSKIKNVMLRKNLYQKLAKNKEKLKVFRELIHYDSK